MESGTRKSYKVGKEEDRYANNYYQWFAGGLSWLVTRKLGWFQLSSRKGLFATFSLAPVSGTW